MFILEERNFNPMPGPRFGIQDDMASFPGLLELCIFDPGLRDRIDTHFSGLTFDFRGSKRTKACPEIRNHESKHLKFLKSTLRSKCGLRLK